MRVLGIQLANGYSSEARVFASLLGARESASDDILVVHHDWEGDRSSAAAFERDAQVSVARLDVGWRPGTPGRSVPARVLARVRFRAAIPRIREIAVAYQPDIIVSSQQKWDSAAAASVAHHLDIPHVVHLHYNVGDWLGRRVLGLLRTSTHVITVSDFIRRQVTEFGVPEDRVTTIHNSMQVAPVAGPQEVMLSRAGLGIPQDAILMTFVARLDPGKGHREVLAAFEQLSAEDNTAYLLIVGDGTIRSELTAQAGRMRSNHRVRFLGRRNDVTQILLASDIFVHPSHADPFPLAVLEASAAGLPVVAFADGGIPEMVVHGQTGLLTKCDDVGALTYALSTLLADAPYRRRLGAAGRARICAQFKPEVASQKYFGLLRRMARTRENLPYARVV